LPSGRIYVSSAIKKHQEVQPCHQESFIPTMLSEKTGVSLVIRKTPRSSTSSGIFNFNVVTRNPPFQPCHHKG